jgi:5-methylcytosine-specific restriction endonuclease McrA
LDHILESIFESCFKYTERNPTKPIQHWLKSKAQCKKYKTLELYLKQDGKCYHCEKPMLYKANIHHPLKTSLDRIIPGSYGGGYKISNLVLSCMTCNKQRGDKTIEEYNEWKSAQ